MSMEFSADKALAQAMDGNIEVQVSASSVRAVRAYAQAEQPQTGLGEEFIVVTNNGSVQSLTKGGSTPRGYLAVSVYCRSNSDGTAKRRRIDGIIEQVSGYVSGKVHGKFYYEPDWSSMITPVTVDYDSGYAFAVLGVAWHEASV